MAIEIKIIDSIINFLQRLRNSADHAVKELKFTKYMYLFGERDDDIYVASYVKSGTTWMQMILYQLTTDGDMNFTHIYDVSPWLRNLAVTDGELKEWPSPRIIKMHDAYRTIPKSRKGRFICVIRDGRDVAWSFYHHEKNYVNNNITYEECFNMLFTNKDQVNWFEFTKEWLENRNGFPVLYVRYEDLKNDLGTQLARIADFIGVTVKKEDVPRIIERISFPFMKEHEKKFGEQPEAGKFEKVYNQFIRVGSTGEGVKQMDDKHYQLYKAEFDKNLAGYDIVKKYV